MFLFSDEIGSLVEWIMKEQLQLRGKLLYLRHGEKLRKSWGSQGAVFGGLQDLREEIVKRRGVVAAQGKLHGKDKKTIKGILKEIYLCVKIMFQADPRISPVSWLSGSLVHIG
jgi:hypothetical protein